MLTQTGRVGTGRPALLARHRAGEDLRTELLANALEAAAREREGWKGRFSTTDHGSVYTCRAYEGSCAELGVVQPTRAIGSSADHAAAEGFNATLKRETLAGVPYYTDEVTLRRTVFRWAHRYNTRRRHSWCRNPPECFRDVWLVSGAYPGVRGAVHHPRVQEPRSRPFFEHGVGVGVEYFDEGTAGLRYNKTMGSLASY